MVPGFINNFSSKERQKQVLERTQNMMVNANYVLSKESEEFELKFSKTFNSTKKSISVANATIALEMIFSFYIDKATKMKKMAIPTNTNFATVASAIKAGWEVYLVDCDPNDLNTNFDSFFDLLKEVPDISALCLVHIGGVITKNLEKFIDVCLEHDIMLFEDCAHAVGSFYNQTSAGSFGAASAFSFFPTKPLGVTEGGIVMTSNDELVAFVQSMRNQGKRAAKFGNLHEDFGGSWRMNEFSAIMCNVLMPELDDIFTKRFQSAKAMQETVSAHVNTNFPYHMDKWSVYKFIVLAENEDHFARLKKSLASKEIKSSGAVYERPIHKQPVFKGMVNTPVSLSYSDIRCPLQIVLPVPEAPYREYFEELGKIVKLSK